MPVEINPLTGQEYYAGSTEDVVRFAKSLNIDQGRLASVKPINVLDYKSATDWWNSDEVKKVRFCKKPACKSCPIYNLDGEK